MGLLKATAIASAGATLSLLGGCSRGGGGGHVPKPSPGIIKLQLAAAKTHLAGALKRSTFVTSLDRQALGAPSLEERPGAGLCAHPTAFLAEVCGNDFSYGMSAGFSRFVASARDPSFEMAIPKATKTANVIGGDRWREQVARRLDGFNGASSTVAIEDTLLFTSLGYVRFPALHEATCVAVPKAKIEKCSNPAQGDKECYTCYQGDTCQGKRNHLCAEGMSENGSVWSVKFPYEKASPQYYLNAETLLANARVVAAASRAVTRESQLQHAPPGQVKVVLKELKSRFLPLKNLPEPFGGYATKVDEALGTASSSVTAEGFDWKTFDGTVLKTLLAALPRELPAIAPKDLKTIPSKPRPAPIEVDIVYEIPQTPSPMVTAPEWMSAEYFDVWRGKLFAPAVPDKFHGLASVDPVKVTFKVDRDLADDEFLFVNLHLTTFDNQSVIVPTFPTPTNHPKELQIKLPQLKYKRASLVKGSLVFVGNSAGITRSRIGDTDDQGYAVWLNTYPNKVTLHHVGEGPDENTAYLNQLTSAAETGGVPSTDMVYWTCAPRKDDVLDKYVRAVGCSLKSWHEDANGNAPGNHWERPSLENGLLKVKYYAGATGIYVLAYPNVKDGEVITMDMDGQSVAYIPLSTD